MEGGLLHAVQLRQRRHPVPSRLPSLFDLIESALATRRRLDYMRGAATAAACRGRREREREQEQATVRVGIHGYTNTPVLSCLAAEEEQIGGGVEGSWDFGSRPLLVSHWAARVILYTARPSKNIAHGMRKVPCKEILHRVEAQTQRQQLSVVCFLGVLRISSFSR